MSSQDTDLFFSSDGCHRLSTKAGTWTNADVLSIKPSGTIFNKIWIRPQKTFSTKHIWKFHPKKCVSECSSGYDELITLNAWSYFDLMCLESIITIWNQISRCLGVLNTWIFDFKMWLYFLMFFRCEYNIFVWKWTNTINIYIISTVGIGLVLKHQGISSHGFEYTSMDFQLFMS